MCQQCGAPSGCYFQQMGQSQRNVYGFGQLDDYYRGLSQSPSPKMSIEDANYILMEVGCNNLLGVYKTSEDAQEAANKICKKNIKKLHIFKLVVTIESENKVSVTSRS